MYRDALWDRRFMVNFNQLTDEDLARMLRGAADALDLVRRLHQAGVRLHLGTDSIGLPGLVAGAALQRELGLFVQAGLSIEAAWYAGTRAAGLTLGVPRMGLLESGAPADLLIFQRDPIRDLSALDSLQAVVAQGRLYPRSLLEEALQRHRAIFEKQPYDTLTTGMIRLMLRSFKTNA
jgi:imidazolonepropionase-like amidohydrolase